MMADSVPFLVASARSPVPPVERARAVRAAAVAAPPVKTAAPAQVAAGGAVAMVGRAASATTPVASSAQPGRPGQQGVPERPAAVGVVAEGSSCTTVAAAEVPATAAVAVTSENPEPVATARSQSHSTMSVRSGYVTPRSSVALPVTAAMAAVVRRVRPVVPVVRANSASPRSSTPQVRAEEPAVAARAAKVAQPVPVPVDRRSDCSPAESIRSMSRTRRFVPVPAATAAWAVRPVERERPDPVGQVVSAAQAARDSTLTVLRVPPVLLPREVTRSVGPTTTRTARSTVS